MSLLDVDHKIFTAVGPSRIAALSFAALARADQSMPEDESITDVSIKRAKLAISMLQDEMQILFSEEELNIPSALEDLRVEALNALRPLIPITECAAPKAIEYIKNSDQLISHCLYDVCVPITNFLDEVGVFLKESQHAREESKRADILAAIENADGVGRHIQLVSVNAAIEAARAGKNGKEFAVIASEIESLAKQTQGIMQEVGSLMAK